MVRLQSKWVWISLLASILILVAILALTVDEQTLVYLANLDPVYLLLAVVFRAFSILCWSLRIRVLSKGLGYHIRFGYIVNLTLLNLLAGALTPGQLGGEPVRVSELARAGVKVGDATAVVVTERLLDGVVVIALITVTSLLVGYYLRTISSGYTGLLLLVVGVLLLLFFFFIYFVRRPESIKSVAGRFAGWWERRIGSLAHSSGNPDTPEHLRSVSGWINEEIDTFTESAVRFGKTARRSLFAGFVWSALFWISEFLVASLILVGLGLPPFVIESFFFQLVITFAELIPLTPGSAGIAEISAAALYGLIVPSALLGVFIALWRLLLYYVNIILGLAATVITFRKRVL